ncbi:hypothetical protein ACHAWU_009810 [Discostella pseudostelligera]|uniref:Uncharacterized protein n=1 Tax=Discostella pseudostelligera TaxID=259834 RepID=A0ABD3M6X5_9STRA
MSSSDGSTILAVENAPSHKTNTSRKWLHNASISSSDSLQSGLLPSLNIVRNSLNTCSALFITLMISFPFKLPPCYTFGAPATVVMNRAMSIGEHINTSSSRTETWSKMSA